MDTDSPYEGWFVCPSCGWRGDVAWFSDSGEQIDYAYCPSCDKRVEFGYETL